MYIAQSMLMRACCCHSIYSCCFSVSDCTFTNSYLSVIYIL